MHSCTDTHTHTHTHTHTYNDDIQTPIPASSDQSCPRAGDGSGPCVFCRMGGWWLHVLGCNPWPPPAVLVPAWEAAEGGLTHGLSCADSCGLVVSSRYCSSVYSQSQPEPHKLSDRYQAREGSRGRARHCMGVVHCKVLSSHRPIYPSIHPSIHLSLCQIL